jgi:16S rRNA (guanine(966)-N(2))-methyltransferase RsmD
MDRVKEALFNIIDVDIRDAHFLDLFAGTGSVAIEALSRGAASAVMLDINRNAISTIHDNLRTTRLAERATVLQADAFHFLQRQPDRTFQYIYIAPPQYQGLWLKALDALCAQPVWLSSETTVIVQIDPQEYIAITQPLLTVTDERKYGNTQLVFIQRRVPQELVRG